MNKKQTYYDIIEYFKTMMIRSEDMINGYYEQKSDPDWDKVSEETREMVLQGIDVWSEAYEMYEAFLNILEGGVKRYEKIAPKKIITKSKSKLLIN